MTAPSENAMRFALKWHQALGVDRMGVEILAKAYDDDMATRALSDDVKALVEALRLVERLVNEGLPKFNWGASALDANAITLLNEVPIAVRTALIPFSQSGESK